MKAQFSGMRRRATALAAACAGLAYSGAAFAATTELLGQPTPGAIGLQQAASPLKHQAVFFHNVILMPIITGITLFVLALLVIIVVRFNKKANPVPQKFTHHTGLEVAWTAIPVLILMFIAIFSFKLLFAYHDTPPAYMTVKATGYQWYWGYEYPDQKIPEEISGLLPEEDAKAQGVPFRLAATLPLVVPVNQVVRVQVTGADVIHSFALPAFGLKIDGVPGRLQEQWFKAEKVGTYYGECSELCGIDHAFMPIMIKVVSQADFDAWVKSKTAPPEAAPAAPTDAAAPAAEPAPAAAAPAAAPAA